MEYSRALRIRKKILVKIEEPVPYYSYVIIKKGTGGSYKSLKSFA
jgi:hypothetical protein